MLSGSDFRTLRDALVTAFAADELDELVLFRLDQKLDAIVGPGPLNKRALDLVRWSDRNGFVADLVQAAYVERPRDATLRQLYETIGMAPALSVQARGAVQAGAPTKATANALEAIVKPGLKLVDMGVWRERLARVEGQVCRIEIGGNPKGTGFLVGPDLVLTNFHVLQAVVADAGLAPSVAFRFDYKVLADTSVNPGVTVGLKDAAAADWLLDSSPYSRAEGDNAPDREAPTADELDFALVRLAAPVGEAPVGRSATADAPPRGWVRLPDTQPPLPPGGAILIAQHPKGDPIKLAMDLTGLMEVNPGGTRVRYATNTEPGSSGSPCFDMDWTLVALHHMGDPAWNNPRYNEGIPIGLVRQRLAARGALAGA